MYVFDVISFRRGVSFANATAIFKRDYTRYTDKIHWIAVESTIKSPVAPYAYCKKGNKRDYKNKGSYEFKV